MIWYLYHSSTQTFEIMLSVVGLWFNFTWFPLVRRIFSTFVIWVFPFVIFIILYHACSTIRTYISHTHFEIVNFHLFTIFSLVLFVIMSLLSSITFINRTCICHSGTFLLYVNDFIYYTLSCPIRAAQILEINSFEHGIPMRPGSYSHHSLIQI